MEVLTTLYLLINFYQVLSITSENEKIPAPENLSDGVLTCEKGWYGLNDKCYRLGGNEKTSKVLNLNWRKALTFCRKEGGNLITIDNKDVQNFVATFFVMNYAIESANGVWIGLHDHNTEGKFEWSDGTAVNFKYWSPDEPSGDKYGDEDCVGMQFHLDKKKIGAWNDLPCELEIPFICQKDKVQMRASQAPLDAKFCSADNNSGWKFRNSCFNLVKDKKTWKEAEAYCQKQYSASLIAVKDILVDYFLDYMLVSKKVNGDVWIGIEIENRVTQKWTSGWFVGYSGFKDIKNMEEGTCAVRHASENWSSQDCTDKHPFVCETSSETPPVLPVTMSGATCPEHPDDWKDLGGDKCYFFETGIAVNWFEASFICMQRGGTLVSLHSREELDALRPFVQFTTKNELHIGLYRRVKGGKEFNWSDKTPFDFQNWDADEPNRDIESCSVIYTPNMKFHDYMCNERKGFICSAKKVLPAPNKTTMITHIQKKCPKVISFSALWGILAAILCAAAVIGIATLCYVKLCSEGRKSYRSSHHVMSIRDLPGSRISRPARPYSEENIDDDDDEDDEDIYEDMS